MFLPVKPAPGKSDKNRKLNRKTVDYLFKKYARLANVYGVTPHAARATFITQALENNCPIEAVQKTVAHAQIKTTQMYDKRVAPVPGKCELCGEVLIAPLYNKV